MNPEKQQRYRLMEGIRYWLKDWSRESVNAFLLDNLADATTDELRYNLADKILYTLKQDLKK